MSAGRDGPPRVLVLGGGFAGIGAALELKGANVEVVLIDRHDYHTFQPLLYQLATGLLERTAVGHSLRNLVHGQENATVHQASVSAVDLEAREGPARGGEADEGAWGTVHLALLPTNEDRAKAVIDWAGDALTHQRTGRFVVETDEAGTAARAE